MEIRSSCYSILQLLISSSEQFVVPAYQRRYAWNLKQLGELYDDIRLLDDSEYHFMGSIVLLSKTHQGGVNTVEVVDGQQRLTTITILLASLRDVFKKHEHNNAEVIGKLLLCGELEKDYTNNLVLGELDNEDYIRVINQSELSKVRNQNLLRAYDFFARKLEKRLNEATMFYKKLTEKTIIMRLDVSNAKDAYRLFEVINNRGLRLTATDIIKNFILGNASMVSEKILVKVRKSWEEIIINLDGVNTENFFRQYLSGEFRRKVTVTSMVDEFKKYYCENIIEAEKLSTYLTYVKVTEENDENKVFDDQILLNGQIEEKFITKEETNKNLKEKNEKKIKKVPVIAFVQKLSTLSEIYKNIVKQGFANKEINRHLFDLNRIKAQPAYTFLLEVFQRGISDKEKIQIIWMIEVFMLRWHICEKRTSELDDIFPKLNAIKNSDLIQSVKKELISEMPDDNEFGKKLSTYSFKGKEDRAKYILEIIEYSLLKHQGEYQLNKGKELHLEHIIPQKISTKRSKHQYGDWESYLGGHSKELHKRYAYSIGNLTLLGGTLNITASNNPFLSKKTEYKKSELKLNEQLVKGYTQFGFKQVEKRTKEMINLALGIWKLEGEGK